MVEKVSGFRTSGGQIIEDEESALIAEAMDEIISEMPELRLIADKVQSRLRRLCLHLQPLAGYYAKNHPRVLGETTLEPALPGKLWGQTTVDGVEVHPGIRFSPSGKARWDGCGSHKTVAEVMAGEDVICDCSALMNGDSNHSPSCITQERKRGAEEKPSCTCKAGESRTPQYHHWTCPVYVPRDPGCLDKRKATHHPVADDDEPKVDYI